MSLRKGDKRRLLTATGNECASATDSPKRARLSISSDEQNDTLAQTQSQSLLSQSRLLHNQEKRCGKVISMHLENFMCHSNLSIEFGQRINFLVGSNGSGKSAILTALVVALGGSARLTNRSTSIQKLIKNGETAAKIEIVLSNSGLLPFQSDVYGECITVVRNIKQSGSTYVLKSSDGSVVSRKLEDLRRLIMYFNIRTENPIFVLNQDAAREFLKELEPSKNYQLFLKASQLDIITLSLQDCHSMREEQLEKLTALKDKIKNDRASIAELEEKLEMIRSLEGMKQAVKDLEIKLSWCAVKKRQSLLDELENLISKVEERKMKLEKVSKNRDSMQQEYTQQISKFKELKLQFHEKCREKELGMSETKKRVQNCKERINALQSNMRNNAKHIVHLQQDLSDLKLHMETCEADKQRAETLLQTNTAKIKELRAESEKSSEIVQNVKKDLHKLNEEKLQVNEKYSEAKKTCDNLMSSINGITGQISLLNANARNKLSIFGEHVVSLVKDIEMLHRQNKFSEMPRGPIGQYIEVPNAKYRDLIENQTMSLLRAFVVANSNDRKVLDNLIKQKYPNFRATIITTRFCKEVYDISNGAVPRSSNTRLLMDEIICNDPVVMNLLIDTVRIETVLITESKETAEYLTSESENVPPNLTRVLVPQLRLEYVPVPHYAMYSMNLKPAKIIQVDVNERIKQLEAERINAKQNCEQHSAVYKETKQEYLKIEQLIKEKRTLIASNEKKKLEIEQKLSELENYDYPAQNDMDVLQKEYAEAETKIERITAKLNQDKEELTTLSAEKAIIDEEMQKQQQELRKFLDSQENIENEEQQVQLKLRNLDWVMSQNGKKLKEVEDLLRTQEEQRAELMEQVDADRKIAQAKGDAIDCDESEEELTHKMNKFKAKIRQRSALVIDVDEVTNVLNAKRSTLENNERMNKILKQSIDQLHASWTKRFETLKRMREHAGLMVQFMFNNILKCRKFQGEINIDHKRRTIDIKVTPNSGNGLSNTRALSGGERSYTTVALLNALWSCSDHPFYFLDEYDVFTDEVNREYITNMLISEGRYNPCRQYCFLTPQDTKVTAEECIKILRLAEPVRGVSNTN